ncbi:hypothetical protein [Tenacibaculum xiamenense]|uniref:hypothetical protein n=1 Tax=Tenacibaculum xiamenense TaxID=1261553 RepID=UPI00389433A1
MEATSVPSLKSTKVIKLRNINDLFSYINMWENLCKDAINYHDIDTYEGNLPDEEEDIMKNVAFIKHKKKNSELNIELHCLEVQFLKELGENNKEKFEIYCNYKNWIAQKYLNTSSLEGEIFKPEIIPNFNELKITYSGAEKWFEYFENNEKNSEEFCRHILYQKHEFIMAAKVLLINHTQCFVDNKSEEIKKLGKILMNGNSLTYDSLDNFFPINASSYLATDVYEQSLKTNYEEEYDQLKKELTEIDKELKTESFKIKSHTSEKDKERILKNINELQKKRNTLNYVTEEYYKKNDFIKKAKESSKNWVKDNLFDKKKAGKDAAKVFFHSVGSKLGKAIFLSLKGDSDKVNVKELEKQVLQGFLETGLTALSTYFLGPLGPTFTSTVMSFFKEKPVDPYLKEFNAIKEQLKEEFKKINEKLDDLDRKLTQGIDTIIKKLEEVKKYTDLSNRKQTFIQNKDVVINCIRNFESEYNSVFIQRNSRINDEKLINAHDDFITALNELIRVLYNDKFDIRFNTKSYTKPSPDSLLSRYIEYNAKESVFFHEVTSELIDICNGIVQVGQRYLFSREKWFATMSASQFFFKSGKSNNELLTEYWKTYKDQNFTSNLTVELESLKLQVIGENNMLLLQNIKRALSGKIDFLAGFGLESSEAPPQRRNQYEYIFNEAYSGEGVFKKTPSYYFTNRYVITGKDSAKGKYIMYTNQKNEIPVPIKVRLSLQPNDCIKINNLNEKFKVLIPSNSSNFNKGNSEAIESFFNEQKHITKGILFSTFSLPIKDLYIQVYAKLPCKSIELTVFNQKKDDHTRYNVEKYSFELKELNKIWEQQRVKLEPFENDKQAGFKITFFNSLGKELEVVKIVLSDYEAMNKTFNINEQVNIEGEKKVIEKRVNGLNRGIPYISTYTIEMPVLKDNGSIVKTLVRTENLRPFVSNLFLICDSFKYENEEVDHFGTIKNSNTGWKSLDRIYSLRVINKVAWYTQLRVMKNTKPSEIKAVYEDLGSVFKEYSYTNKYNGSFDFQYDGNFVMYADHGNNNRVGISGTLDWPDTKSQRIAYLSNEGKFIIVEPNRKIEKNESYKVKEWYISENIDPEPNKRKDRYKYVSNRLFVGDIMYWGDDRYRYRIESENGKYYAEIWCEEKSASPRNDFEVSLKLRKHGGHIIKDALKGKITRTLFTHQDFQLKMQGDGNLVAYCKEYNIDAKSIISNDAVFASDTHGQRGCILCITNNGELFLADTKEKRIIKWLS